MLNQEKNFRWENSLCNICTLSLHRKQVVKATPCPEGGILAIGEAPGRDEDNIGKGFVGEAGKNLRNLLNINGLSPNDFGLANICRCRPENNRKPRIKEIELCLPYLNDLISICKPKVILAVGGRTAVKTLCGNGTLTQIIKDSADQNWSSAYRLTKFASIQDTLAKVAFIVPMPHTSSRVFNNPHWRSVAEAQVKIAAQLWKDSKVT